MDVLLDQIKGPPSLASFSPSGQLDAYRKLIKCFPTRIFSAGVKSYITTDLEDIL